LRPKSFQLYWFIFNPSYPLPYTEMRVRAILGRRRVRFLEQSSNHVLSDSMYTSPISRVYESNQYFFPKQV
jgi:hypothetical protein